MDVYVLHASQIGVTLAVFQSIPFFILNVIRLSGERTNSLTTFEFGALIASITVSCLLAGYKAAQVMHLFQLWMQER